MSFASSPPHHPALLRRFAYLAFCCLMLSPSFLSATENRLENQEMALAEQQMLALFYETSSLPTRTAQAFNKLPAAMNVITAEQIRQMGARDLRDILRRIPGLQLGIGAVGYSQVTMRGMVSHGAEKLKFMVDGHNVDITLTGGSALFFADFPVDSIQKVEFLRGPGSALYGSDALLGVINIVTSKKTNRNKTEITARLGSYETQRYNLESAGSLGSVQLWGSANYLNSNGADVFVAEDGLSASPVNADISNAPGHTSEWIERTTLNLSAETEHIQFQGQYITHEDGGFFNPGMSLSDQSSIGRDYFWTTLGYNDDFLAKKLTFKAEISFNRYTHDYDTAVQPPGVISAYGVFPDGMQSITEALVDESGLTLQADGYFFTRHTITLSSEIKNTDLHDATNTANFNPEPLPTTQDVSSEFNWIQERTRLYFSIFLQDQYQYEDDLVILVSGRYDHYDDVGSAISPNLGVAYHFLPDWQFKLLYGQAFRAPSFRELYKLPVGNILQGDPELKAESVNTWQTVLEWKSSENLTAVLTAYHNDFKDTIETTVDQDGISTFSNQADSQSAGIDLELHGKLPISAIDLSWFTTVSYIDSQQTDNSDRPGVASWLGTIGFDYHFADYMHFHTTLHYTGEVFFDSTDPRDEPESYILVDTALTLYDGMGTVQGLDLTWSIHNLFDQEYAYPELSGKMPNHFPRPGISSELWLSYRF